MHTQETDIMTLKSLFITGILVLMLAAVPLAAVDSQAEFEAVVDAYGTLLSGQLHNYHLAGTVRFFDELGAANGTINLYYKKPHWFKQVMVRGDITETVGAKDQEYWRNRHREGATPRRRHLRRSEAAQVARRIDVDLSNVLAQDPATLKILLEEEPYYIGGVACRVLKIWPAGDDFHWTKLVVDPDSHRIRRLEYFTQDEKNGEYHEFAYEYLAHETFGGQLLFPSRIRQYEDGKPVREITVTTMDVNTGMPASLFKPE